MMAIIFWFFEFWLRLSAVCEGCAQPSWPAEWLQREAARTVQCRKHNHSSLAWSTWMQSNFDENANTCTPSRPSPPLTGWVRGRYGLMPKYPSGNRKRSPRTEPGKGYPTGRVLRMTGLTSRKVFSSPFPDTSYLFLALSDSWVDQWSRILPSTADDFSRPVLHGLAWYYNIGWFKIAHPMHRMWMCHLFTQLWSVIQFPERRILVHSSRSKIDRRVCTRAAIPRTPG